MSNPDVAPSNAAPADFSAGKWVLVGLGLLILSGLVGYFSFAPPAEPPPPEVLNDPFLMEGRSVFLSRCVPCHGLSGKGNGPLSTSFGGEQVGDLTDGRWKHGDKPDDVLRVIRAGVTGTRMAPWGPLLDDVQIRSVAGYCYALSKLPVPESLREADRGPLAGPR
ncbi:c-type cytochrome [Paludisphaera mucosa]|uniref:C-type cytochrome n=1 Tax=Paludisphaera mucosa TaxID=3030827 RepID=A0ABT6F7P5_9BACT|nr:c-type cytochrome [Paludisphaera mucosa]MDG3003588.1 c-type cytochrome [Paludisphaera mucosa]